MHQAYVQSFDSQLPQRHCFAQPEQRVGAVIIHHIAEYAQYARRSGVTRWTGLHRAAKMIAQKTCALYLIIL
jgi:hypothetical protein